MLTMACSTPLRGATSGGGGTTSAGGGTAIGGRGGSAGAGGLQPVTINLSFGGMSASIGVTGAGGVIAFGGASSSGGTVSTGGVPTPTTECTGGRCLVTLAAGREHIWPGIAVEGTSVYWTEHSGGIPNFPGTDDGRVMKVPSGGGPSTMLASRQDYPSYIRVDATSVYWTTLSMGIGGELYMRGRASVMRAALDGSKASTVVFVDPAPDSDVFYGDIAVDATSIYWAYLGTWRTDHYEDGAILRVSLVDGTSTTLASGQSGPYSIAVDASSVYWVNDGASRDDRQSSLMKVALEGGLVTTLDASPSGHSAIALDATNVYWTSPDGTVMKLPLEGGSPIMLAAGQSSPMAIAVDTAAVYWANQGDGTIMKVPLQGGAPTTLASGQSNINAAIAVDATSVYWTSYGTADNSYQDGMVLKLTPK